MLADRLSDAQRRDEACLAVGALPARPFAVGGGRSSVTASMGVATSDPDEADEDLVRQADAAMYSAEAAWAQPGRGLRRGLEDAGTALSA